MLVRTSSGESISHLGLCGLINFEYKLFQFMQACHWKAHKTFTNFYIKALTWIEHDKLMNMLLVVLAQVIKPPWGERTSVPKLA